MAEPYEVDGFMPGYCMEEGAINSITDIRMITLRNGTPVFRGFCIADNDTEVTIDATEFVKEQERLAAENGTTYRWPGIKESDAAKIPRIPPDGD